MSNHDLPLSGHPYSDKPFDSGVLNDSDANFLAELDRALAIERPANGREDEVKPPATGKRMGARPLPMGKAPGFWDKAGAPLALLGILAGIWMTSWLDERIGQLETSRDALQTQLAQAMTEIKALREKGPSVAQQEIPQGVKEGPLTQTEKPSEPQDPTQTQSDTPRPQDSGPPPAQSPQAAPPKIPTWTLNLYDFRQKDEAEKAVARLQKEGIQSQIASTAQEGGSTLYRVVVTGFKDFSSAKAYADKVRTKPGLATAWISHE